MAPSPERPSTANPASGIDHVAIKLGEFWTELPAGWFVRAESMFRRANIVKEETMYDHVVSYLPQRTIASVFDIIQENARIAREYPALKREAADTPEPTPYTNLKNVLIERYSLSETTRLEQILSRESMGNRKPSDFYRHLSQLAGGLKTISQELLYSLWSRALPREIQTGLKSSSVTGITEKLSLADSLYELSQNQPTLLAVNTSNEQKEFFTLMGKQIEALTQAIANMNSAQPAQPTTNSSNQRQSRSHSRKRDTTPAASKTGICWYHSKYKEKASKCLTPCTFKAEN